MCSNYKTVTALDHLVQSFGVQRTEGAAPPEFDGEIWPLKLAPFITLDELGRRRVEAGKRSEEHTSELQSLMRNSFAVFCLKKKILVHRLAYSTPASNHIQLPPPICPYSRNN